MAELYGNKELFEVLLRVGRENKVPVRISSEMFARAPFIPLLLGPNDIVIDRIINIGPNVSPEGWSKFYTEAVKSIQPGVTEMIVHLASDDEEMRAATIDHPNWGAAWR